MASAPLRPVSKAAPRRSTSARPQQGGEEGRWIAGLCPPCAAGTGCMLVCVRACVHGAAAAPQPGHGAKAQPSLNPPLPPPKKKVRPSPTDCACQGGGVVSRQVPEATQGAWPLVCVIRLTIWIGALERHWTVFGRRQPNAPSHHRPHAQGRISLTVSGHWGRPAAEASEADAAASEAYAQFQIGWIADPLFFGAPRRAAPPPCPPLPAWPRAPTHRPAPTPEHAASWTRPPSPRPSLPPPPHTHPQATTPS